MCEDNVCVCVCLHACEHVYVCKHAHQCRLMCNKLWISGYADMYINDNKLCVNEFMRQLHTLHPVLHVITQVMGSDE